MEFVIVEVVVVLLDVGFFLLGLLVEGLLLLKIYVSCLKSFLFSFIKDSKLNIFVYYIFLVFCLVLIIFSEELLDWVGILVEDVICVICMLDSS